MFITSDGRSVGDGGNDDGQLGDGTLQEQDVPVKILEHAKAVSCGAYHTIVMLETVRLGSGDNSSGQLATHPPRGPPHSSRSTGAFRQRCHCRGELAAIAT
jgi:alpha-tubulin suppressor-like RCC1 family protein